MKKILFSLALLAGVSANAQLLRRGPQVMPNLVEQVRSTGEGAFEIEALRPHNVQMRKAPLQAPYRAVEPMLTTKWAQDSPFNRQLPSSGSFWGTTYLTGCVATAMAQILNFYEYPAASIGKGSYSTDGTNYKTVATTTTFQWDQMADRYATGYTETQAKAVGLLMRDCGYVSNMIYTSNGSGTTAYDAGYGLTHNMQYDSLAIKVANRQYYRDEEWRTMIYNELLAGRPVLYDAVDPSINMGHAFVFDGLDAEGRVHVNWGWSGNANGYFDIDNLTPSYSDAYGQKYSYNFNDEHKMIIGFKPQSTPDADEHYESFFAMQDRDSMWFENDILRIKQTPIFNFTHLNFSGLVALVVEGIDDGKGVVLPFFYSPWSGNQVVPFLGGMYPGDEFLASATLSYTDGKTPRPDGTYLLYMISWATPEMTANQQPQYVRIPMNGVPEGYDNIGVWEAKIVNGHWDAKSVKRSYMPSVETAIQTPHVATIKAQGTYNLSGQRISPKAKGLVIRNGKKVIVR